MLGNRVRLAAWAKVVIRAFGVHTLVTNAVDGLGAGIAGRIVHVLERIQAAYVIIFLRDFNETMVWMLFGSDTEARRACVKVGAVKTFISNALNPGIA
jgi:hypothetical protein